MTWNCFPLMRPSMTNQRPLPCKIPIIATPLNPLLKKTLESRYDILQQYQNSHFKALNGNYPKSIT